jgi:hypothetical protein
MRFMLEDGVKILTGEELKQNAMAINSAKFAK